MKGQTLMYLWWPPLSGKTTEGAADQGSLASKSVRFEIVSADRQTLRSGEASIGSLPRNLPCVILLAPSDHSLISTTLPKLTARQLQQGLGYLVETQLMSNPEDVFVLPQPSWRFSQAGQTLCSVVDQRMIRSLMMQLADLPLQIAAISSEPLIFLPEPNDCPAWVILHEQTAWVCRPDTAPWMLPLTDLVVTSQIITHWCTSQQLDLGQLVFFTGDMPTLEALQRLFSTPLAYRPRQYLRPRLGLTSEQSGIVPLQALRQAGLAKRSGQARWRLPAMLALGLAGLWTLGLNAYAWRLHQQQGYLRAVTENAYLEIAPNAQLVADPVLLLERHKQSLSTNPSSDQPASFINVYSAAAQAMAALPLSAIDQVRFQDKRLMLTLVNQPNPEQKSAVDAALSSQNIKTQWANTAPNGVTVTLTAGATP